MAVEPFISSAPCDAKGGSSWFPMEDLETFDGFPDDQDLPDIPAVPGTADPAPSQCWGGELSGDATHCTPGFVPGSNHLKSKWCAHCTQFGIVVAASRVRAIGTELHGTITNGRGSGMYMHLPVQPADAAQPARAPPRYRLINQTKDCRGPRMVVFENPTPPPELEDLWSPMPPGVVRDGERVHLKLGQGTIIPVLPPGATLGGPSREGSTSRSSPAPAPAATAVAVAATAATSALPRAPPAALAPGAQPGALPSAPAPPGAHPPLPGDLLHLLAGDGTVDAEPPGGASASTPPEPPN